MPKGKKTNLYCPLHGTPLYGEKKISEDKIETDSEATCYHENCPHKVFIRDRQSFEQLGEIEIQFT